MNFTKVLPNIQNFVEQIFNEYPIISNIVQTIGQHKGKAYLVGGAVRDLLLGLPLTDIDVEVHGLELDKLSDLLSKFGPVSLVGKSFGVLKIHGLPFDWALPRTDSSGRKPQVEINHLMSIDEALRRRDLTINAMAINMHNYEFIDPFGGFKDLTEKVLRSPDTNFFTQDPLRFYRVMQFISRFEMYPDKALNSVCEMMDISSVSIERIEYEFEKLLLKSKRPSLGLRWLHAINRVEQILPELAVNIFTEQDPKWHPEGNVYEHSMQTVDAAALLKYDNNEEKLVILYAALCHDIGKSVTTQLIGGILKSPGHAEAGVPLTNTLLKRITRKHKLINSVCILVKYHMQPGQFVQLDSSLPAYKRLALKLEGHANLLMLSKLAIADARGRNGKSSEPLDTHIEFIDIFIKRAQEAKVLTGFEPPVLYGRDIKDLVESGPEMGNLLKYAYEIQLKEGIKDRDVLKARIKKKLQRLH